MKPSHPGRLLSHTNVRTLIFPATVFSVGATPLLVSHVTPDHVGVNPAQVKISRNDSATAPGLAGIVS